MGGRGREERREGEGGCRSWEGLNFRPGREGEHKLANMGRENFEGKLSPNMGKFKISVVCSSLQILAKFHTQIYP